MFLTYLCRQLKLSRWAAFFLIALAVVTSVSPVCHSSHGVDRDCVVCQGRHEWAAIFSWSSLTIVVNGLESRCHAATYGVIAVDANLESPSRAPPA
jgi:hypothetical protein